MTAPPLLECPDAETVSAFAEGKLSRSEARELVAHLDRCARCMTALEGANLQIGARPAARPLWLAVAAVLVLVAVGVTGWRAAWWRGGDTSSRLIELAPRDERLVEPRLTGGFEWAPYRGPLRDAAAGPRARTFRLTGAVGELLETAERDHSAAAQHAAGAGLVLLNRPDDAIAKLRAAAAKEPGNARVWNDLGAAEYAAALSGNEPSRYPEALAALDRALTIDPNFAEALFNRALTLERLGMTAAAREAWERYLRADSSSKWADEARERLRRLPSSTTQSMFRDDQPRLEAAAIAGDAATVESLVRRYPQPARTFAETDYLGKWGEAEQRGDAGEATRMLTVARAVGDALLRMSGEGLLHDAVRTIETADADSRRLLAEAYAIYKRGRMTYSQAAPAKAEPDLRRAAELFAAAKSPMVFVARYYAANTRFDQSDGPGARRELELLLAEVDARPRYPALGAQVRWQLALCAAYDDDWGGTLPLLVAAEETFRRLGESANLAFIEAFLGDALATLGRPDESWAARIRSFEALTTDGRLARLAVGIGAAVRVELRSGRLAAARALSNVEMTTLRAAGDDVILVTALARAAVLKTQLGDDAAAWADVREASRVAARIGDPSLRKRGMADVQFARGAVQLRDDPSAARGSLAEAIAGYVDAEAVVFLPESHLLRARAESRLGDAAASLREIGRGIDAYERHRVRFAESVTGTGVHNAGLELYHDAIRLQLARGDDAAAFAFAERMLAQIVPSTSAFADAATLQQRLAGSGAAVLELVALPDEIVGFAVTPRDLAVHRTKIDAATLRSLGEAACGGDRAAARRLYELLIRPAEEQLRGAEHLIVVAGAELESVPFAALYDAAANERLVERMSVAIAPAASVLLPESPRAVRTIAAMTAGAAGDVALPASRDELADLTRLYGRSVGASGGPATFAALVDAARRADVVHISGHADTGREAALVLGGERVSWRRAASAALEGKPLVVLAACATLRSPRSSASRALSLGAGFLAGGAREVVGTLAPIPDNDARAVFARLHHYLAAGRGAAEALRLAQLEFVNAEERGGVRAAWQSVALLTRTIPKKES